MPAGLQNHWRCPRTIRSGSSRWVSRANTDSLRWKTAWPLRATRPLTDLYFCDAAAPVHRSQHRRAFLSRVSTANTSVPTPESPGTQIHSSNPQETILGLRLVIEGGKGWPKLILGLSPKFSAILPPTSQPPFGCRNRAPQVSIKFPANLPPDFLAPFADDVLQVTTRPETTATSTAWRRRI
jgi:hypothetical protein